ncbi:MAG: DUF4399 domain-containing protein [Gammaproteobacteria bacterium]|nr:DUF4399 domain-containing protein [Gammaproteobacteria bacterium]
MKSFLIAASVLLVFVVSACGRQQAEVPTAAPAAAPETAAIPKIELTESPDSAAVFFITPADGDTVSNPVSVEFGISAMTVVKAGVDEPHSGHHHLLIDTDLPALGLPIPADDNHVHFGDGSTSTEITLAPGQHTLRLLLGDHRHIPHDPPVASEPITVTVE